MKITLPVLKEEFKDGRVVSERTEKEFNIDVTLVAQMRYETKFPELAKSENLLDYAQRIFAIKEQSQALVISKLKLIYCWFDTEMSFEEFLAMFTCTNINYTKELVEKLSAVFTAIADSSAEKN